MKSISTAFVLLPLLLTGCAVTPELVPAGGSRADGTVTLYYEYNILQRPRIDIAQGVAAARARCEAWGYHSAQPFGGSNETCVSGTRSGCDVYRVTMEFQCTGRPAPRG